jgi:TetR/AcrR family transcriptional repressor of nem operon
MDKAQRTKQLIVEKTAPIFNKKGFAGTSISDLTNATGLTKGSIYGNFENKDEVALAVFDYNVSLLNKRLNAAAEGSTNVVSKLHKMADFYIAENAGSVNRGGCPILNTAVEADDTHPGLKTKASKSFRKWKKNLENLVKQGIEEKIIKTTIDPVTFATEYIALIEGGILLARTTGDITLLQTCVERIHKIIDQELKR